MYVWIQTNYYRVWFLVEGEGRGCGVWCLNGVVVSYATYHTVIIKWNLAVLASSGGDSSQRRASSVERPGSPTKKSLHCQIRWFSLFAQSKIQETLFFAKKKTKTRLVGKAKKCRHTHSFSNEKTPVSFLL